MALPIAGCGSAHWLANGWLDPSQVGQFNEPKRNEIRQTLSILEEPPGIQNVEEPSAEDLVPWREVSKIGPGDVLNISIFELQAIGAATTQQLRVGNSGYETISMIGPVRMEGLTPRELELEIKDRLREAEILPDADVQVFRLESHTAQCSVIGNISRPGVYALAHSEVKLLEMLATVGGLSPTIERVYIFRKAQTSDQPTSSVARKGRRREDARPGPNRGPFTMSEISTGAARVSRRQPEPPPPARDEGEFEPAGADEYDNSTSKIQPKWDAEQERWVIDDAVAQPTSVQVEAVGRPTEGAEETPVSGRAPSGPVRAPAPAVEEAPPEEAAEELISPTRIIEIPAKELMEGDPRYNVVLRPFDLINVPIGNVGEFFMMGNVARPGAYSLTGRRLTVKEAIASAGGLGPLAWPSRADLVRRVSEDEEQIIQLDLDAIFAGEAPDFYLKPSDVLNVGTTVPAYFFAVLRNSFRFTYGAGFVYDRNFGDSDSFGAREQLKQRRDAERQQKGLPF